MRCMVGLDRPNGGTTTFDGQHFESLRRRCTRSASCSTPATCTRLVPVATTCAGWPPATGCPRKRVDEVLGDGRPHRRRRSQVTRLLAGHEASASASPACCSATRTPIILDEPANGLDPEGIRWIRDFLVYFAKQGRTVLVSSHLLSEMSLMADDLVVIGRGRLIEQGRVGEFLDRHATRWVRVRTPTPAPFAEHLRREGATLHAGGSQRHRRPRPRDGASRRVGGTARGRAARAVDPERVAGGRLLDGHSRRAGVPIGVGECRRRRLVLPAAGGAL